MQPIRIQRTRKEKQVSPNGLPIVYVGRPGKWGNPYKINETFSAHNAVILYCEYLEKWVDTDEIISELKGKNLSCWCNIGKPCHADILLNIANS